MGSPHPNTMLSSEQLKLRTKLEESIEKATNVLNNFIENGEGSRKKYVRILRERLAKCHVRLTYDDLNNDAIVFEARRTLSCASTWLKSSSNQTPVLRRKAKTDQRESLSFPGGDGSGMYAFKFGMEVSSRGGLTTQLLFQNAGQCENEEHKMSQLSKKFYFADNTEALRFKNAVFHFGLHFVIDHDLERYCLIRRDDTTSRTMTVLEFDVFPLRSYKIDRSRLLFNDASMNKLRTVKSVSSAIEFLDEFGSHIALDLNTLGGILCKSVEVTASQALSVSVLERYADEIVSERFTQLKYQPDGLIETLRNSEDGSEVECQYKLETLGPLVAQPILFEQLLEANPFDLRTIERDFLSLVGIWEIIEQRNPTLKTQADLLRRAWLEKAVDSQGSVVQREIKKVQAALKLSDNKMLHSAINGRSTNSEKTAPVETSSAKIEKRDVPVVNTNRETKVTNGSVAVQRVDGAQSPPKDPQVTLNGSKPPKRTDAQPSPQDPQVISNGGKTKKADTAQSTSRQDLQAASGQVLKDQKRHSSVVTVEIHRVAVENDDGKVSSGSEEEPLQEKAPKLMLSTQKDQAFSSNQDNLNEPPPLQRNDKESGSEHQAVLMDRATTSAQQQSTQKDEGITEESGLGFETEKPFFGQAVYITEHPSSEDFTSKHLARSVKDIVGEIEALANQTDTSSVSSRITRPYSVQKTPAYKHDNGASEAQRVINATINLNEDATPSLNKKLYANYFIADYPFCTTDPKLDLLMSVRRNKLETITDILGKSTRANVYDLFLEILNEIDAPSIRETFSLLLENKYLIPLFNPLTKQSYLGILKDISFRLVSPKSTFINLGSDKTLSRVAIISAKKETRTEELVRSLFDIQTFHHEAVFRSPTQVTIDFGVAQLKQNGSPTLLSYITGDFKLAVEFVREFADHLIVEHCPDNEDSVYEWVERCWGDKQKRKSTSNNRSPFADIPHVTFWTPSLNKLRWKAPKDNFHVFGPDPLMIEAPLNDQLSDLLGRILRLTLNKDVEEKSYKPASNRKSLREVTILKDLLPLEGLPDCEILTRHLNKLNIRQSLPLQRIFREENDLKLIPNLSKDPKILLQHLDVELQLNITLSMNIPLVDIYLRSLRISDSSMRILVLRLIEEALFAKTEEELLLLGEEIVHLHRSYIDHLTSVKSPSDTTFALKQYIEAKENYRHLALYAKHLWREISLAYFIRPYSFTHLPALAAQYMLDGFKLELLQDDTVNVNWIHAVLFELGKKVQQEKQRFLVVSCIGQQDRNKSSFLANLFGRLRRNEANEHYNTGVFMQVIPVIQRDEYDYVLVLDAEDCWQSTRYEALQALRENYQIATLCSLVSDVIIIVNPKEDDIVDTDVLTEVFSDSAVSLRCMCSTRRSVFSVYNWIDDQLPSSGPRKFRVREWSNGNEIRGENLEEITSLAEFREIIHKNVTEPRNEVVWKSRDLSTIERQLTETWAYACSIDFPVLHQNVTLRQIGSAV